jgi:hypothetical protein
MKPETCRNRCEAMDGQANLSHKKDEVRIMKHDVA